MLNPDYSDMLSALSAAGVEYLVVGAYALAAHGLPRATGDIDFWVRPSSENASAVLEALGRAGGFAVAGSIEEDPPLRLILKVNDLRTAVDAILGDPPHRLVFDPAMLEPDLDPVAGPLLAEAQAPVRVDLHRTETDGGRLGFTASRTGLSGGRGAMEGEPQVLISTHWRSLGPGMVTLRLEKVQAVNSDFEPLPLPQPLHLFLLHVN